MLEELIRRDNAKISETQRDLLHDFFLYMDMPSEAISEITDTLATWIVENSNNFGIFLKRREFETYCYLCAMNLPLGKNFSLKTAMPFCVNTWAKNKFEVITVKFVNYFEVSINCVDRNCREDLNIPDHVDNQIMEFYKQFLITFDNAEFLTPEMQCKYAKNMSFPETKEDVFLHFIGTMLDVEILPVVDGFLYKIPGDSKNEYAQKVAFVRKFIEQSAANK